MSKFKRTNRAQTSSMEKFLVGGGDQALASGALVDGTTALNIANQQLGVLSWDHDGTVALGNFVDAGNADVANVSAIKILQGTPLSGAIHQVEPWEVDDLAYVESGVIHRDAIRSVTTMSLKAPSKSAYAVTDLPTPVASSIYGGYLYLNSVRNDRDWSDNDEVVFESVETPADISGVTDITDWVLNQVAYKFNTRSKVVNLSNSASVRRGNKNYIVLAINTTGGSGQALGTITCAGTPTTFDVMNDYDASGNVTTTSLTADAALVSALAKVIKQQADAVAGGATITNQITTSSTVEVIDLNSAGDAANVDAMIVVGIEEKKAKYFDNINQVQPTVHLNLSDGFRASAIVETKVYPEEGFGQGAKWAVKDSDRARLQTHTAQNQPFLEFFSEGKTYVDPTQNYTATIIEFYDYEETLTTREVYPKKAMILLPASYTCVAVSAAVTNLASGDAIPTSTDDSATVTSLNNILGAWLESARAYTNHQLKGDATSSTYFV